MLRLGDDQRLLARSSFNHLEPFTLQIDANKIADWFLILQYQHFHDVPSLLFCVLARGSGQLHYFIHRKLALLIFLKSGA
ncbi:hypothetical protein D3C79_1014090 [compost metagenome]